MIKCIKKIKKRNIIFSFILCLTLVIESILFGFISSSASIDLEPDVISPFDNIDITKTGVEDDLTSMGLNYTSNHSYTENKFIAMSQYYDLDGKLRTYIYLNILGDVYDSKFSLSLSTSTANQGFDIEEVYNDYQLNFICNDNEFINWCKFEILGLPNLDYVTRRYFLGKLMVDGNLLLDLNKVYIFHGTSNAKMEMSAKEMNTILLEQEVHCSTYGPSDSFASIVNKDAMAYNAEFTDSFYVFFSLPGFQIDDLEYVEVEWKEFTYEVVFKAPVSKSIAFSKSLCESISNGNSVLNDYIVLDECSFDFNGKEDSKVVEPGTTKVSSKDSVLGWLTWYDYVYKDINNIINLNDYKNDTSFEFYSEAQDFDWAVNFLNTKKTTSHGIPVTDQVINGTSVYDVAVVKLTYIKDGQTYNAYAVTKPTSDIIGHSSDSEGSIFDIFGEFGSYVALFLGIAIIAMLAPAIKPISEGIVTVVRLPFDLIASLFKKRK